MTIPAANAVNCSDAFSAPSGRMWPTALSRSCSDPTIVYNRPVGEERQPASTRAYEAIRQQVLDGVYPVGSHLREELLSENLGVSRTPVREALRRLAGEGLIEFVQHRGAHVAAWTEADLEEIFDLRSLVEGYAAKRAATRASASQVLRLRTLASYMEGVAQTHLRTGLDEIAVLNNEFHGLIVEAAESSRLVTMAGALIQLPLVHRTFRRYSDADLKRSLAHHHELVDAIAAGDAEWAETAMRSHIRTGLAALRGSESAHRRRLGA